MKLDVILKLKRKVYYKPDSVHEIEFFIERSGAVIPIEVKAGNRSTPSLNQYIARYRPPFAYKHSH